jgi:ferrous iron transport protein A
LILILTAMKFPHCGCHGVSKHHQHHSGHGQDGLRSLASFPNGSIVRIARVEDCACPRCRVFALGLTPGTTVEILSSSPGPCRLRVRGSDLVVGHGIAEKILAVEEAVCPA